MTLFSYFLIGHLIGDFLLQTNWMAMHKSHKWLPLLTHCFVYTTSVVLVALLGGFVLSFAAIFLIFISHVILDKRFFVAWWVKTIMKTTGTEANWLTIVVDQVFHILIIAFVAHFWF